MQKSVSSGIVAGVSRREYILERDFPGTGSDLSQVPEGHRFHAAPVRRICTSGSRESPGLHPPATVQAGGRMVRAAGAYAPPIITVVRLILNGMLLHCCRHPEWSKPWAGWGLPPY